MVDGESERRDDVLKIGQSLRSKVVIRLCTCGVTGLIRRGGSER